MIGRAKVRVVTKPNVDKVLMDNVSTSDNTRRIAHKVIHAAKEHFLSVVKHTHPVTVPPYADSFYVERGTNSQGKDHHIFTAGNDDPVAMLVEFGAHPGGGPTRTLGYRPLGHGIDAASGG